MIIKGSFPLSFFERRHLNLISYFQLLGLDTQKAYKTALELNAQSRDLCIMRTD